MKARAFATEAGARLLIAMIDGARGYPKTEQGTRVGGGRHVDSVTTTTDIEPIRLRDGTWAVRSDRLALAGLARTGEREIGADVETPVDVRDAVVVEDEKP